MQPGGKERGDSACASPSNSVFTSAGRARKALRLDDEKCLHQAEAKCLADTHTPVWPSSSPTFTTNKSVAVCAALEGECRGSVSASMRLCSACT